MIASHVAHRAMRDIVALPHLGPKNAIYGSKILSTSIKRNIQH
jgi:hypothetical protein